MQYRIVKETLRNGDVNYYAHELIESSHYIGPNKVEESNWEVILDEGCRTSSAKICNPLFAAVKTEGEAKSLIEQRKNYKMAAKGKEVVSTEIIEIP